MAESITNCEKDTEWMEYTSHANHSYSSRPSEQSEVPTQGDRLLAPFEDDSMSLTNHTSVVMVSNSPG
jgi:hypothetical protein